LPVGTAATSLSTATTDTVREAPYTFASRFEGAPGAIPEELLVTGHAGCYHSRTHMGTENQGTDGHGYSVEGIHFVVAAELTEQARALCSISKILRIPVTLNASRITTANDPRGNRHRRRRGCAS
jgi:osmotically inducible protein OsmC